MGNTKVGGVKPSKTFDIRDGAMGLEFALLGFKLALVQHFLTVKLVLPFGIGMHILSHYILGIYF